jgi:hypothetical protein
MDLCKVASLIHIRFAENISQIHAMKPFSISFRAFCFLKSQYCRIADKPKKTLLKRATNDEKDATRGLFLGPFLGCYSHQSASVDRQPQLHIEAQRK